MHVTYKTDTLVQRIFDVALPKIQHIPTHILQFGPFPQVPFLIEPELPNPKLSVRFRDR